MEAKKAEETAMRILARVGIRDNISSVHYQAYEPENKRTIVKLFYKGQEQHEGFLNIFDNRSYEVILERDSIEKDNIIVGRL